MPRSWFFLAPLALAAGIILAGSTLLSSNTLDAASSAYDVWAFDQADTDLDAEGGGQLFIWDGRDLERHASRAEPEVIDLAQAATDAGCDIATRPHMALPNHTDPPSHVIVANVASGDVHFINADTREIDGCVGDLGAAHAAVPDHDNQMVLVADIGGQTLHKISTDYDNGVFAKTEELFLGTPDVLDDLGTATANPICHEFDVNHGLAYVTLAGGGLIVVDPGSADGTEPMEILHVYAADEVPGIGCGAFPLEDGRMITNGESGQFGGDDFLFVFDVPAPGEEFEPPVTIELPGDDTHGVAVCETHKGDLFAWTVMRVSNHINVIDLQNYEVVRTWSMDRPFSPDPKPDITMTHGNSLFVTLRGPKPLTAITALENPDRIPAVAVLSMHRNCQTFNYGAKDVAPMPNPNMTEINGTTVTTSDPHGLAIVPRE